jgi:hypothetical protein
MAREELVIRWLNTLEEINRSEVIQPSESKFLISMRFSFSILTNQNLGCYTNGEYGYVN